jgi:hypothetical protein
MPFIGNKPSAVPLTSADITDGIIVNADISSTAGITLNKISGNPSFRNIVINGDMQVAQRSTSVASITSSAYKTLDRWYLGLGTLGTWTMSQSTDVPSGYGFANSLKLDNTTADASPASGDTMLLSQFFEGQNLQYLKKGTANAVSLTASFWVKSTKTGTFICELQDTDNSRSISKSYTVSASNTWEFKTITFAGDTTGTLNNDNGDSLGLNFWLGAGSTYTSGTLATSWASTTSANRAVGQVNIADSTSNDFLITGVQLEAGTSATDFEFLPYDVDLLRCQRYYYGHAIGSDTYKTIGSISYYSSSVTVTIIHFPTSMRAKPSVIVGGGTDYFRIDRAGGQDYLNGFTFGTGTTNTVSLENDTHSSGTAGHAGYIYTNNTSAYVAFESEL